MKFFINAKFLLALLIGAFLFPVPAAGRADNVKQVESELMSQAAANIEKYRKGDVEIFFKNKAGKPVRNASLEITQVSSDFLFGCTIFPLVREGSAYRPELFKQVFADIFNFAIFPFYWAGYERVQGMPGWQSLLPVIEWCEANGITTKGHPLVWTAPSGKPAWLARYSNEESLELLKARMTNVVGGFRGRIDIWDVFNEPVNTRAWDDTSSGGWWIDVPVETNADLVEHAFKWAHRANPGAHLILNEFYQITREGTRERFYALVKELQQRNTPISGLGIQAHEPRQEWYPPLEVWKTFDRIAELGYPIHITEFTPQSGGKEITGGWREGRWNLETQAEFAEQMFRLCFGHPAVVSINFWGLSDRGVWLPGGGLVTEQYRPKPIYNRLKKLIHEQWRTRLDTSTDSSGSVRFRGFYGDYLVRLRTPDGRFHSYELDVRKVEENRWVFTVETD